MGWDWDEVQYCIDCDWYDDTSRVDTFMRPFGDDWICGLCAESRGIDLGA